jgi:hypothetical protein
MIARKNRIKAFLGNRQFDVPEPKKAQIHYSGIWHVPRGHTLAILPDLQVLTNSCQPLHFSISRSTLLFRKRTCPAGPITTTPCARGPRPRGGLNVILCMLSLTVWIEAVAAAPLELDSANFFCLGSSQAAGCLAELPLHEDREELRRLSELLVLWLPTGVE